jgi:hypothetical protein
MFPCKSTTLSKHIAVTETDLSMPLGEKRVELPCLTLLYSTQTCESTLHAGRGAGGIDGVLAVCGETTTATFNNLANLCCGSLR